MSTPAAAGVTSVESIGRDWENREFVETVKLNILAIVRFLNTFDSSARYKLSRINEKLNTLERTLEHCDAAVRSAKPQATEDS